DLGMLLVARKEHARAEPFFREAVAMHEALYPREKYPEGRPALAQSLGNLGLVIHSQGDYARAEPFLRDAFDMQLALFLRSADIMAEAEALNMAWRAAHTRDAFLAATRRLPPDPEVYRRVWRSKAALTRLLERRHLDQAASRDEETRQLGLQLRAA